MMKLPSMLARLLYPDRCTLCHGPLHREETDICHTCRTEIEQCPPMRKRIPHVAQWSAVWYYKDDVRKSLLRCKFARARTYCAVYAHFMALKVPQELGEFDILTWVPVSNRRKRIRGFDQSELLALALGRELDCQPACLLRKVRDNPPQSSLLEASQRKANVLGVYQAVSPGTLAGKRVLLLDDIITTGSTVSEAARVLLTAGAKEVQCAAVAAAEKP